MLPKVPYQWHMAQRLKVKEFEEKTYIWSAAAEELTWLSGNFKTYG